VDSEHRQPGDGFRAERHESDEKEWETPTVPERDLVRSGIDFAFTLALALALVIGADVPDASADPAAAGFQVKPYASVPEPLKITFAPNGELYAGRNPPGDPGGTVRIHRVGVGGSPVVEFGPALPDPDAVLFDANGSFAAIPGSVIVGGAVSGLGAAIHVIAPDGSAATVIGPTTVLDNPSDMTFDGTGRLLFTDHGDQDVKVTTGSLPTTLFALSSNTLSVAYDPATDRVYSNALDGVVRVHQPDGTLIDASFAASDEALAVGPGDAVFGNDVYTVDNGTGELIRIDLAGNPTVIGSGFSEVRDLEFGPDGALYASEAGNERILRIAPVDAPALSPYGWVALAVFLGVSARRTLG
jgi:hypothetical protein